MNDLLKCLATAIFAGIFPAGIVFAEEARKAPVAAAAQDAAGDAKDVYRAFLEAIQRCDLDAALKCCAYREKDAEAMKVVLSLWIAHLRFEKVVKEKFGPDEDDRALVGQLLGTNATAGGLEVMLKRLPEAEVKVEGEKATVDMRWDKVRGEHEFFDIPLDGLRKVDGRWRLDAGEDGDGFFEKGGFGNLFRNMLKMLEEASAKVTKGDFKNVEELKGDLDERERILLEPYEDELKMKW